MRKKDLLAMPELTATEEMLRLARTDRGRSRKLYAWERRKTKAFRILYSRAVQTGCTLKAAFFCREDLLAGEHRPRYEVYISLSEEKDLTYLPQENKWSESRIGNLAVTGRNEAFYRGRMEEWEEPDARETVCMYLYSEPPGNASVFEMVDSWQQHQRILRLRGRHQREKARIDMAMSQVPDLPSDWEDWVYKSAYSHAQYMMYHYGDKNNMAWCTACGNEVYLKKKPKHQEYVRCPHCGKKILALSWNRQKTISDSKKPAILQERRDYGYVLRIFGSRIVRRKESDWKLLTNDSYIHEDYRIFLDREFRQETVYEYTFWKNRRFENDLRWCHETNHGYGYYYNPPGECILYYRNLKKLRKGTGLSYIPIEELYRKNEGCYGYAIHQLRLFMTVPQFEYLIKMKLYRLSWDISGDDRMRETIMDKEARKPWTALKIDRQQLEMGIRMNITGLQLRTLQSANELGIRLERRQLEWYARELGPEITKTVLRFGHPVKMMKYIQELQGNKIRSGDYIDYLEDVRILNIEHTEDVLFPRNFEAAHERLSDQRRERDERIRRETIMEKDRLLQKMLPGLRQIYGNIRDEAFEMVLPTCKEDFNREGRENHNCVGGRYFDTMLNGQSVVLFLRRKEAPDKSFCTVEMDGSRILQCRAIRNSTPPQEVTDFMKRYSREVEKRIQKKEAVERARILVPAI